MADSGKRRFEPPRGAEKKISRPIQEESEAHDETMGEAGAGAGRGAVMRPLGGERYKQLTLVSTGERTVGGGEWRQQRR